MTNIKSKNTPKEGSHRQKVVVKRFSHGEWREKTMDLLDIYAMISGKKYEKQVFSLREELIGTAEAFDLAETDAIIHIPTVQTATGMVVLSLPTSSQQQLE